ncbi:MAG: NADPH-dependent FMN reductase [Alphaproteobacteria bacterium]|nr:NADPH-dependent FMN reductase [Alphaproteobacteria bacterium]
MSLNVTILYGSVRSGRQGIRAARFIDRQFQARGHRTDFVDTLDYRLPLLDRMYKEYDGDAPEVLERLAEIYRASDGFVVVSGEYNHGIPPALKNLLDHFLEEYFCRPSGIVCYSAGRFGGVRAAMQLRMTLAELGTPSIPTIFPVPNVQDAFAEDGTPTDPASERHVKGFLDEFEWYAGALKAARAAHMPEPHIATSTECGPGAAAPLPPTD